MSIHDVLKAHARLVARHLRAGRMASNADGARDFMIAHPDAVLRVVHLIHDAALRKTPDESLIVAYRYMLLSGLQGIRYQIERGQTWAETLLDGVRSLIAHLADGKEMAPGLLAILLNTFIEAGLEPGDELTALFGDIALDRAKDMPADKNTDIATLFDAVVQEADGNEFEVFAGISEVSQALPPTFRQALLSQIASASNPVLRDTAILYLLDPSSEVRRSFCAMIAKNRSAEMLSPTALRRMITLRNWLPEDERQPLDAAIRMARQMQVECAPWPDAAVQNILASNIDGAGAQSVFAIVERDGRQMIATVLVKQAVGIADAWCLRDQSHADIKSFLAQIHERTESISVSTGFLRLLIAHHLAIGHAQGKVPSAGFLDVIETIGLERCHPAVLPPEDLIKSLEKDADPQWLGCAAVQSTIEESAGWLENYDFMDSWFEDDAVVDQVLARRERAKMQRKVKAIIENVLEPRRATWAERFLWTALWLKQQSNSPWTSFFLLGRELHRGRPLAQIPAMQRVAEATVIAAADAWR